MAACKLARDLVAVPPKTIVLQCLLHGVPGLRARACRQLARTCQKSLSEEPVGRACRKSLSDAQEGAVGRHGRSCRPHSYPNSLSRDS